MSNRTGKVRPTTVIDTTRRSESQSARELRDEYYPEYEIDPRFNAYGHVPYGGAYGLHFGSGIYGDMYGPNANPHVFSNFSHGGFWGGGMHFGGIDRVYQDKYVQERTQRTGEVAPLTPWGAQARHAQYTASLEGDIHHGTTGAVVGAFAAPTLASVGYLALKGAGLFGAFSIGLPATAILGLSLAIGGIAGGAWLGSKIGRWTHKHKALAEDLSGDGIMNGNEMHRRLQRDYLEQERILGNQTPIFNRFNGQF